MIKSRFTFFSAVVLAAVFIGAASTKADINAFTEAGASVEKRVVMVIADYLNIEDINRMAFVSRLAGESHVALMNNRQTGKAGAAKSKLVIGSGKRLELRADMVSSWGLTYDDIDRLRNVNRDSGYLNYIGYLGDVLDKNNGASCFLGNSDAVKPNRSSILVAMDSSGAVDIGETENITKTDYLFPCGRRTNYSKLAELYKQYLPASSFMVIDTGDMERLEQSCSAMTEQDYRQHKAAILKDIDGFMEELVRLGGFNTLIFISTYPSKADAEMNNKLTPVVVYDNGNEGVLYSRSTRREGIILNADIADYILYKLGYTDATAIKEYKMGHPGSFLIYENKAIIATSKLRTPVLTFYSVLIIIALAILFVRTLYISRTRKGAAVRLFNLTAYIIMVYPLVLLIIPAWRLGGSWVQYSLAALGAAALISMAIEFLIKNTIYKIFCICSLILGSLYFDILTGSSLMKQSVLGYDPIIGARFYGIGNEYAGIFIGCSIMIFGCLAEIRGKIKNYSAILYFTCCLAILGVTFMGANFGGAISAAFGYLLAYFLFYGIKFNKRNLAAGFIMLCITAAFLTVVDTLDMENYSHVGGLVKDAGKNGIGVVLNTVQRKLSMNLRLVRYTIWTKVLFCIIAVISFMLYKPVKLLRQMLNKHKDLEYAWTGTALSAVAGFAVNDSGVVLAATTMIYVAFTMLVMLINKQENENGIQNFREYKT